MTSRVELDIDARRTPLAEVFADPRNNPAWMDDIDRIESVSGDLGKAGSTYRLVPKRGDEVFVATVTERALPASLKLVLDSPRVSVSITDTFHQVSDRRTKLVSEEVFRFKSAFGRLVGLVAGRAIRKAHRRHMEAFKAFAERLPNE
jgi:hypothetical protein